YHDCHSDQFLVERSDNTTSSYSATPDEIYRNRRHTNRINRAQCSDRNYLGSRGIRLLGFGVAGSFTKCIPCTWKVDFLSMGSGLSKEAHYIDHLIKFGRDITGFNVIVFLTANLDQILIGKLYG